MKVLSKSLVLLCGCLLSLPVWADDFVCDAGGTCVVPALVEGNVIVTNGTFALLTGTEVQGNVEVSDGGLLQANGALIDGNVEADGAGDIIVQASEVTGNIEIKDSAGLFFLIQSNDVLGNIEMKDNDVVVAQIGGAGVGNVVSGNVEVKGNFAAGFFGLFFDIIENVIAGNLECSDNTPPPVGIDTNTVYGDVECDE